MKEYSLVNKENTIKTQYCQTPLLTPSMTKTRGSSDRGQESVPDSTSADESKQQHCATLQGYCWERSCHSPSSRYPVMVEPIFDYQFRLILIGDSTVGKSSLLKYFTDGKFFEVGSRCCSAWLPPCGVCSCPAVCLSSLGTLSRQLLDCVRVLWCTAVWLWYSQPQLSFMCWSSEFVPVKVSQPGEWFLETWIFSKVGDSIEAHLGTSSS